MTFKNTLTPTQVYELRRKKYLPEQLARARLKVIHLEREAARLGLHHLIEDKDKTK